MRTSGIILLISGHDLWHALAGLRHRVSGYDQFPSPMVDDLRVDHLDGAFIDSFFGS